MAHDHQTQHTLSRVYRDIVFSRLAPDSGTTDDHFVKYVWDGGPMGGRFYEFDNGVFRTEALFNINPFSVWTDIADKLIEQQAKRYIDSKQFAHDYERAIITKGLIEFYSPK